MPDAVFSIDDSAATLLAKSYQGEILGEIFFARIGEHVQDADHKAKMATLSQLECRTKEALLPVLEKAGISTQAELETLAEAEDLAAAVASLNWLELMGTFEPVTTQFAAMYARIAEVDPSEREISDLLVAHELALRDFGRHEIAGRGDDSLAAITGLPHMQ
ncbi:MAG TPA: hypothetical protein VHV57_11475 [Acidimicrobiales bacterium]|jgi:hypothetical protein|nr:hypothetical protein [Acidimicrobiales bacterium]